MERKGGTKAMSEQGREYWNKENTTKCG